MSAASMHPGMSFKRVARIWVSLSKSESGEI
jgi:hypothetical protein